MWKFIFLIFCILLEPIASRRGGGFGGRGSSGSRGSSGTYGGNSGGVQSGGHVGAPSGGFNQPKAGGGFGGGGFGGAPARSSFSSRGSGMGSPSSGGAFKSALAGAAIGGLAGVAVGGLIAHATSPFSYGGHNYYWGPEYYRASSGQFMCSMPLNDLIKDTPTVTTTAAPGANVTTVSDPNNVLQNLKFENGSKPHSIVWSCKTGTEVCCGTECCPNPQASSSSSTGSSIAGIIIGVLIAILLISCCCCFLAYKLCREAFERFLPTRTQNYEDKYDDYSQPQQSYPQSGGYPSQSYPMQPYPSQQAQPSYGYPPQPQSYTPNAYPQYPHEQKY